MDYEQKYKETLERARRVHDNRNASSLRKAWIEEIFPELKESEGERVRKELYEFIKVNSPREDANRFISWLEKQKEQNVKAISWRKPDDCADIPEGHYVVIAYMPGVLGLGYVSKGKVVCAPEHKPWAILYIPNANESIIVEQKEQKHAEWSEDDKVKLQKVIAHMSHCVPVKNDDGVPSFELKTETELVDWLNSLQPQHRFKLTQEQVTLISDLIEESKGSRRDALLALYEELRK